MRVIRANTRVKKSISVILTKLNSPTCSQLHLQHMRQNVEIHVVSAVAQCKIWNKMRKDWISAYKTTPLSYKSLQNLAFWPVDGTFVGLGLLRNVPVHAKYTFHGCTASCQKQFARKLEIDAEAMKRHILWSITSSSYRGKKLLQDTTINRVLTCLHSDYLVCLNTLRNTLRNTLGTKLSARNPCAVLLDMPTYSWNLTPGVMKRLGRIVHIWFHIDLSNWRLMWNYETVPKLIEFRHVWSVMPLQESRCPYSFIYSHMSGFFHIVDRKWCLTILWMTQSSFLHGPTVDNCLWHWSYD